MYKKKFLFVFLGILIPLYTHAAETTYRVDCPASIDVSQQLTSMNPDWRVIVEKKPPHFLSSIAFYVESPEEQTSLAPEMSDKNSKATWTFSEKERIYAACGYQKTTVRLTQVLPEGITSCTATYNLQTQGDSGFLPEEILCYKKN